MIQFRTYPLEIPYINRITIPNLRNIDTLHKIAGKSLYILKSDFQYCNVNQHEHHMQPYNNY